MSIDGGGIRGILPATILDECERHFLNGQTAGSYFDMIAGTSTGGIIALGLSRGMSAREILELYLENGGKIFPTQPHTVKTPWWKRVARIAKDAQSVRYDPDALQRMLEQSFGRQVYGDAERRLVIPTFDARTKVNVLKTPHHPDFQSDWQHKMVDVARATSAAPTYFPPHRIGTQIYADGGIWANNPVMLALVDAMTCYKLDRHKVRILSLGCGSGEIRMTEQQIERGGQWDWRTLTSVAMELSSQNADGQAGLLIGREQMCRLDDPNQVHPIALDDFVAAKNSLPDVGRRLFKENKEELRTFFDQVRPSFKPYYGPRSN